MCKVDTFIDALEGLFQEPMTYEEYFQVYLALKDKDWFCFDLDKDLQGFRLGDEVVERKEGKGFLVYMGDNPTPAFFATDSRVFPVEMEDEDGNYIGYLYATFPCECKDLRKAVTTIVCRYFYRILKVRGDWLIKHVKKHGSYKDFESVIR